MIDFLFYKKSEQMELVLTRRAVERSETERVMGGRQVAALTGTMRKCGRRGGYYPPIKNGDLGFVPMYPLRQKSQAIFATSPKVGGFGGRQVAAPTKYSETKQKRQILCFPCFFAETVIKYSY